jgi:SanA protein
LKYLGVAFATLFFVLAAANFWVIQSTQDRVYDTSDVPSRTWAIVLGARVWSSGVPSHSLEDRLETALQLYRDGKVKRILVTGDHGKKHYDEVQAMHDWLTGHGVPSADIVLDHAGFRTLDSMARATPVFGVKDAIVCTQRFHLYRALYLADAHELDVVGVVADRREYERELYNQSRESIARVVAVVDLTTGRQPHFPK